LTAPTPLKSSGSRPPAVAQPSPLTLRARPSVSRGRGEADVSRAAQGQILAPRFPPAQAL
jgi:hypothetical protein